MAWDPPEGDLCSEEFREVIRVRYDPDCCSMTRPTCAGLGPLEHYLYVRQDGHPRDSDAVPYYPL